MSIVKFPNDEPVLEHLTCAICLKQIIPSEATAGLLDTDSEQRFACNGHFWNPHQFITGWADFLVRERARGTRKQFALEYGGELDVRPLR